MVEAASNCKVSIVTKRQKLSTGETRFITSIWALSDDRTVRLEQERKPPPPPPLPLPHHLPSPPLPRTPNPNPFRRTVADSEQVIPYTVWGNTTKVVLRLPADLKFHSSIPDHPPTATASTSWLNYNFPSSTASTQFQTALMGKTLLLSVKTKRTMRIHDGLVAGTFAYQEQMCGLENLRIWRDDQTEAVVVLVHYSAQFRDGYLAFHLNSARDPVRIKEEGEKCVRVKGINVPLGEGKKAVKRGSGMRVL